MDETAASAYLRRVGDDDAAHGVHVLRGSAIDCCCHCTAISDCHRTVRSTLPATSALTAANRNNGVDAMRCCVESLSDTKFARVCCNGVERD